MKNMKLTILLLFVSVMMASAQQLNYPLSYTMSNSLDAQAATRGLRLHSSFRPIKQSDWKEQLQAVDSSIYHNGRFRSMIENRRHPAVLRSIFSHDMLRVDSANFHLAVNPILNCDIGKDRISDSAFTIFSRGIEFKGSLGKNFSFYSNIIENQSYYPNYINKYIKQHSVVPGQGMYKLIKTTIDSLAIKQGKDTTQGFDFSSASGYISYSPSENINVQLGNTKNFIGNGYRSLLLSDNTYNYPALKFTFDYKGFRYVWMLTEFQNFEGKYYNYHTKKHGSFMYLNWNPNWRFEMGLFESSIWKTSGTNYTKRFPFGFFNPVILTHALQYGLGGEHNVMLGTNVRLNPDHFSQLYGQLIIDDITTSKLSESGYFHNKLGYQIGGKIFDAFRNKLAYTTLFLQLEYNQVQPYTYASTIPYQSYSNENQPLAHPLGSGFKEWVGIANLRFRDFFAEIKYTNAQQVYNEKGQNYGSSIFVSDLKAVNGMESSGHTIGNGTVQKIINQNIILGYTINYRYLLQVYIKVDKRTYNIPGYSQKLDFVSFGLRTNLENYYFDF